jgi:Tol biopolymer transport system component
MQDQPDDRLDSWKKIASYLRRDVTTVQRWERREAMPVHRHLHDKMGSVFAFRSELDAWWQRRRVRLGPDDSTKTEEAGQGQPAAKDVVPALAPERAAAKPMGWGWIVAAALIVGAMLWAWRETDLFWRNPLADAKFTRLLDFAGTVQTAALSRDGRYVAFLGERNGQVDAWLSEAGSGTSRNLTLGGVHELVNPSIRTLGFSPDSSLVTLWTRRPDGSQPSDVSILAAPVGGGGLKPYLRQAAEFDWSHDGQRLVYHTTAPGDPLFVRGSGKAGDRMIYVAPAGVHCHFPIWSPDDAFIYFVRGVPPDDWDIWRIQPSGAGLQRITTHHARLTYPVMVDPHTLLYLLANGNESGPGIYAVDVERRVTRRVSSGLESYASLAATGDGTRLVATITSTRTGIWRMSLTDDRAGGTAAGVPSNILMNAVSPRLGADDSVLYVSWRGERQGIWSATHGAARELWSGARSRVVGGPTLSPDGRHIAFTAQDGDRSLLYIMDSDGSNVRALTESLPLVGNPSWARDGRSVVSAVVREGEPRLTQIFLNGDPPLTLVHEYSTDPVWSPDGQFLIYSGADVGTTFPLRAAAADGRPYPLPGTMLTRGARRIAFFRDSESIVILRGDIHHKDLWLLNVRTAEQRLLAELPADFLIGEFDISTAGNEIVFDRVQSSSELALIERAE